MNRDYWNAVADTYEDEIFSVLAHDTSGLIRDRVKRYGGPGRTAADLGCGVGHCLPLLTGQFGRVFACDLSPDCLDQARKAHGKRAGLDFEVIDLARGGGSFPSVDFALCINVLITSSLAQRTRILANLHRYLKDDGHILIVVPSVESGLLTSARLIQWNQRSGHRASVAENLGLPRTGSVRQVHRGHLTIDGVVTKHYLREELEFLLPDHGLNVLEIEKIPYPWTSEFTQPPNWMGEPLPWDWLVLARRA
jgi:SAM-dependent methyltransferase